MISPMVHLLLMICRAGLLLFFAGFFGVLPESRISQTRFFDPTRDGIGMFMK